MRKGKTRAAAALCCCVLIVLLLSGQQQQQEVAAAPFDFCKCYRDCYSDCRDQDHLPKWRCPLKCLGDCTGSATAEHVVAPADCDAIRRPLSFCDTAADAGAADYVDACVEDCTNNLGAYAPTTTADLN